MHSDGSKRACSCSSVQREVIQKDLPQLERPRKNDLTKEPLSSTQTTAWSYDMQGSAEKGVEKIANLEGKTHLFSNR